jgi:hypothetical protein
MTTTGNFWKSPKLDDNPILIFLVWKVKSFVVINSIVILIKRKFFVTLTIFLEKNK